MSITLPPITTSQPAAASTGNNAAEQQPADADSFGQVLNRSLANTGKAADNSSAKVAEKTLSADRPARRQTGRADADKQDPAAALLFTLFPLTPAATNPKAGARLPEGGKPPPAAAETQLSAAIAAGGGGTPAVTAAPADSGAGNQTATPAATAFGAQIEAQAMAPAAAQKERGPIALQAKDLPPGERAASVAANDTLPAAVGDAGHQQAARDDGRASQHSQYNQLETPTPQELHAKHASEKPDLQRTASATPASPNHSDMTAGKAASSTTSQLSVAATAQSYPALGTAQPAATAASPAAAPVTLPLTPAVGSGEWAPALGKQMVWMGNANHQVAELHLNPPDLGPLKVTLTISDNQAQASFVSAHQSVRTAVEAALPQLRSTLADNGISLGNTSVSADTQQQNPFAQQNANQSGARGNQQRSGNFADLDGSIERSAPPLAGRERLSAVDTFA